MRRLTLNLAFVLALLSIVSGPAIQFAWAVKVVAGDLKVTGHLYAGNYGLQLDTSDGFNIKSYGAHGDAAQYAFTVNAGGATCTDGVTPTMYVGPGLSACATLTPATYTGAGVFLTNGVETAMDSHLAGGTLGADITTTSQTSITLQAPTGTHWQTLLGAAATGEMLIQNELIAYKAISTDTFTTEAVTSGGRGAEGTTAATHTGALAVDIGGFDLVDAGNYTAVRSYSWPIHEWDAGDKLVIPARGWTYASPGQLQGTDPSAITGADETGWYGEFLPRATSTGTAQVGSWFTPLVTTISSISGSGNGETVNLTTPPSANIVSQVETATVGHDDTAAWNAAVAAASAAGNGSIIVPPGRYIINGTANLASHIHVVAYGAIILQNGHALSFGTTYNGGGIAGAPTLFSGAGTLTADDPQMSTFSYNSGIVNPVQYAAGGSCSETTTYYYKVSGLLADGVTETAASTTTDYGRPSSGNDKIEVSILQSPYPVVQQYHVWRSDGVDSLGNYKWKLWRTVNSKWSGSPQANEWTVGYSALLGLQDDCSTFTPDATKTIPLTTNATYLPLTDITWDGGTIYGNNACQFGLFVDMATNVHIRGVSVYGVGDAGIKLKRVNEGSVEHTWEDNDAHGVIFENSQHVSAEYNKLTNNSVAPALNYHDQAFAAASLAHSTGNPYDFAVTWRSNEITGGCRDYGVHCQGLQNYGAFRLTIDNNQVHDLYGPDPNDTTYGAHGSIWTPAVSHGLPQAMRFRDSSGQATNNRIENPHSYGILVDDLNDFYDQSQNDQDNTPYNDRPLVGGNVELLGNTIEGATSYGVHYINSSGGVPTASVSNPVVNTGTFSPCPVNNGTLLTAMDTYATGHAWAPPVIPPGRINENTFINIGMENRAGNNDAIEYYATGGEINHNKIEGVTSAGIVIGLNTVNGANYQPFGVTVNANTIHNLAPGGSGANNLNWKTGILNLGLETSESGNTVICQDSGTLASSNAYASGYTSGTPASFNYTVNATDNHTLGCAQSVLLRAAAGHNSQIGSAWEFRNYSSGDTALSAGNFGTLTGWGTASVTAVTGTDAYGTVTITVTNTTGATANPSLVLTYADGAWPAAPHIIATRDATSTGTVMPASATSTTTAATLSMTGTVALTGTYIIHWWASK